MARGNHSMSKKTISTPVKVNKKNSAPKASILSSLPKKGSSTNSINISKKNLSSMPAKKFKIDFSKQSNPILFDSNHQPKKFINPH